MKNITVCGIQIEIKPCDIDFNIKKSISWIEKCIENHNPDLIVFPETVSTGFNTGLSAKELNGLVDKIPGETTDDIAKTAKENKVHIVWTTYERADNGKVYNSAVLINNMGEIAGVYRKTHPFPLEKKWTVPGEKVEVYNTDIGNIGIMICYDGDFPELARIMGIKKSEIIVRPSAFLRSFDTWKLTNTARAYDSQSYLVAVNAVGNDAGENCYYGHSMIVSPHGRRIAQGLCRDEIIYAELNEDPMKYASYGSDSPMISDNIKLRNPDVYGEILES